MQNQDPLNPIDSADYAVQLATFSGVEQQVRTNQLLVDMQGRIQQSGMAEMAAWIGKEARSAAPIRFEGAPIGLTLAPAAGATEADLVVRDAQGQLISREAIPASPARYTWLGGDATGTALPAGQYRFFVESRNGDEILSTTTVETYSRVLEVRSTATGSVLLPEGGVEIPASDVSALRQPQG
jgi:flagellar basal-body rod modification protein FlgD